MWKSKAPPLMVVLLWHHLCYYKRHKALLAVSVLLPFILLGLMMIVIWQTNSTSVGALNKPLRYSPAEQQTTSFLSSGVLQYVQGGYSCYQTDTVTLNCPSGYMCAKGSTANSTYYTDRSLLDYVLNDADVANCPDDDLTDLDCNQLFQDYLYKYDPSLALMMGTIVYYPNGTGTVAEEIMNLIRARLATYGTFVGKSPQEGPVNFPSVWNSLAKYANISKCWVDVSTRVRGFKNKDDLLAFTQTNLVNQSITDNNDDDPVPQLWGAINFDGTDQAYQTKTFSYSLMREVGSSTRDNKDIWLQDLIEEAALKLFSNTSSLPISVTMKELPQKCWTKPNSYAFNILLNYFPTASTIGFMLMQITLLGQLITEKYLRLGEYLHIMGVSDFKLKLSWILFYALMLLPISFLLALIIYFTPPNIFSLTDASIFFVIFISYNLSQLCWSYFLCSVMVNPAKVRLVIAFVNVFLSVFSFNAYNFAAGQLTGAFLVIIRLLSLQSSTPYSLAICYVINWESIWIGAEWKYFFYSPNKGDGYNGFGECILWMLGDSVLYVLLGWYFKHVMPGLFGVKYPLYFFLLPSYWCPKRANEEDDDDENVERNLPISNSQADIEPDLPHVVPGIVIRSLTKKYVEDKVAINNVTITFNKNEVTAFLGENGAGKTTTMNILVGLISATSGTARVHGLSVAKHMNQIRKIIGFVPQYDILYPDLSVEDHIQFYGWLKGLSTEQIWLKMNVLLKRLGLEEHRKVIATSLSGGQKRKLSILSAYIGNPEVVILDEPTSGVDPFSRRSIWDLISLNRKTSTTILSTHFMDEADMLGDRIAIISTGNVVCVGSGMYLKNHYGQGYRITVATDKDAQNSTQIVQEFLCKHIPNVKLVNESGSDKTFAVPINNAQSTKMIDLLESFETNKDKLGVVAFGVSEPSLEDVFFTATGTLKKSASTQNYGATLNNRGNGHRELHHLTGFTLLFTQFMALIKKRYWITFRQKSVIVMQMLLPLAFVAVMILISSGWGATSSSQNSVDFYQVYKQNVFFFQNHNGGMGQEFLTAASKYGLNPDKLYNSNQAQLKFPNSGYPLSGSCPCNTYCTAQGANQYQNTTVPSNDLIYALDSSANLTEWVILANQSDHWITGGFEFFQMPYSVYDLNNEIDYVYSLSDNASNVLNITTTLNYTVIWTTPDTNAATLNSFNNLLIRAMGTNFSIILNTETANLVPPTQNSNTQIISAISSATTCYFLIMAYIFASFGLADFLQMEKIFGLKQLQFIAGANPITYWCSNLLWDLLQFTAAAGLTFILLAFTTNLFTNDLVNLLLVLMPFAVGCMSFTYLMTFVFDSAGGFSRMVNLCALLFQVIASIVGIFSVISDEAEYICQTENENPCVGVQTWVTVVSVILCLIPYYNLAESITYIALVRTLARYNYIGEGTNPTNAFNNLLQFSMLGRRIAEGWIVAVVLFLLVLLMEYRKHSKATCTKSKQQWTPPVEEQGKIVDSDVLEEEQKIMAADSKVNPLIVKKVYKIYPKQKRPAVNGVSFSIPRGQCFGLLGINGAGKTSLFRILTGFQPATDGSASIEGMDINRDWQKIGHYMSYCPQENTLFHTLTPERHFKLFGALRGLTDADLDLEIQRLVKQVGLENYMQTMAFSLSGGNQRKLQFALALLDYRPLIFLDEPTTGMDPAARRLAWNGISDAIGRGCSVVLTSHSMEECEELCHRLVIMVLGNFACIGSVQYLKDKIGNTYTFKIKLTPDLDSEATNTIKQYFDANLPGVMLSEEHGSLLIFEIPASHVKVSNLFKMLTQSAQRFKGSIEDFSISQISLERVFINMAERQEINNSKK